MNQPKSSPSVIYLFYKIVRDQFYWKFDPIELLEQQLISAWNSPVSRPVSTTSSSTFTECSANGELDTKGQSIVIQ